MNTTEVIALPKFTKIDASASDKGLIQSLRARMEVSEKQLVHALLLLASKHDAELLKNCNTILDDIQIQRSAEKAAKKTTTAKKTSKKELVAA